MHKEAEKLVEEVRATLDKHGFSAQRAYLSTNCKASHLLPACRTAIVGANGIAALQLHLSCEG